MRAARQSTGNGSQRKHSLLRLLDGRRGSLGGRPGPMRGRLMRVTALGMLVWLAVGLWAPSGASAAPMNWSVSLPSLGGLLFGSPAPRVPRQQGGTAAHLAHYVRPSATRAGRGAGRAPGKGAGQLPAYHPYVPARKSFTTGPGIAGGFNARTSKPVASAATATSDLYKNADGTYTKLAYSGPVNYQTASGAYKPISTSLVAGQGGRWQEKANSLSLTFAPKSTAADLASLRLPSGQSYSFGLAGTGAVTGVVSGPAVTYPGVLPGTDLTESATRIGLKESLVLHSASAPSTWTFPLRLSGLTATMAAGGSVDLVNRAGKTVVVIPHGFATDSAYNPKSGNGARTEAVTYQLVNSAGGQALQVSLSKAWLDDPARVFPVTVDPSGNWGTSGSTYVLYPYTNDYSSDALMQVGTWDGGTNKARSFYHFWCLTNCSSSLHDYHVTSATLEIFDAWAYTCTAEPFRAYAVSASWSNTGNKSWAGPSVDWNAELGSRTEDPGGACPSSTHTYASASVGKWMNMSVSTTVMNDWTLGTLPNYGISVNASESDSYQYKQFDGYNSPNPPYFEITYSADTPPQVNSQFPPDNYSATTLTPELQASGSDADNWPDSLTYRFTVENSSSSVVAQSGWQSSPDWTVPSGKLAWNQTYYWYAQDYDGMDYSTVSLNALSTPVPQPLVTSALSQNSGGKGFDPANNNYTTSVTDAQVPAVGPALAITRDYNSEDPRTSGAFGAGWSSMLDMRVAPGLVNSSGAGETVVVTYPDGQQVGFGVNADGSFTAPQGRFATLASASGGGYTLTDKNDTVYSFTQSLGSGVYGITSISDSIGHALNFTWNSSGQITTITSAASGRALHITWATPSGASHAHVATVYTDPVTAGDTSTALTWAYHYSGDQLTSVCPPGTSTACTDYSYTAGTGYRGAVLDSGPHSYWPLDEGPGTATAASAVLVNEGTDNGTYTNVALGQAGALAGSSATSAGFNGSSSYVSLPDNLVSGATYQSVSMWFKTTSTGQVLFSYSKDPVTDSTTPGNYTPELYVGSSGYLYGEFWDGSASSPIKSTSVVNDGKWHQAVLVSGLTSGGDTEQMYVDGTLVGGLTGTVKNTSQEHDYIGAGFIGGGWPDEPHHEQNGNTGYASFFNGDIASVGFWNRPLTEAEVTAMYQAGTSHANLLTTITRPTGSVYANVAYNPGTGAVTQVTDDNGGVWKIGAPADTGSSQVYVSSVLGSGPADYWRFAHTGTTDPVNQVNGGTASNVNVTEGAAGPFTDTSSYSFNGSSSYVNLPSSLISSDGGQTVSLWFKTSQGGGILFGYANEPISNGTASDYTPALYLGPGGDLHGEFWDGSASPIMTSSSVADGKWHNAVLAASGSSQTLYLDGKKVGSLSNTITNPGPQTYDWVGTGLIGSTWPNEPHSGSASGTDYYTGDIGEVAFYNSDLSAAQVAAQYDASKYSSGLTPVQTVHVTDPGGKTITYAMDPLHGNRLISETDALGNITRYGYDTRGFLYDVVDPNGNETITGHDVRGNVVSETTCQDQAADKCSTAYYTYYPDDTSSQLSPNAENDLLLTSRGPGSASSSDNTYLTSYGYNSYGEQTKVTTPPVAGFPSGRTTTTTYTTSTTAAVGGGDTPAGLPATVTTPGGALTATQYYSNGDVAKVTDPDGLVTTYTYDGIGRLVTKTVTSKTFPNGLTTTYAYNQVGEVVKETDPPVTDRVTGSVHTPQITTSYDADGDVLSQTTSDLTGGDASRTVTNTYNSHDQLVSSTDPAGAKTTYTYDAYGNRVSQTDPAGNVTGYAYDADGHLLTVTLENYTGNPNSPQSAAPLVESSRAYDPAGRLASVTNAMGFTTSYTYTDNGLVATVRRSDPATGASFTEQSSTYNGAGQLVQQVTNNGATTTSYAVDAAGRTTSQTLDPSGLDRTTAYTYSPDNYVVDKTLTGPSSSTPVRSTSYTYDPMGNMTSRSVSLTGAGGPAGWWRMDQTSGTSVPDASGTGFTGTASNVTWSGGAGVFNGSSSQVLTRGPVLNTTGSFTVSAWVNLNSLTGNQTVVSQQANLDSAFYLKYYPNGDVWQFARPTTDTTSPSWAVVSSSSPAVAGTWTMLTGVYNAGTGEVTLYVNGAAQGSMSDSTPFAANGPLAIGWAKWDGSAANFVNGSISDVRVYQRALSASQVQGLYTNGRGGGADAPNTLTTTWTLGERGLPTSMTGPDGNTTYYSYDAAGQLAVTTGPVVSTQVYGGTAAQTTPVTMTGYDTFAEPVEQSDANGNVTVTAYDADGRPVSVTQPGYTPPGSSTPITAVTSTAYNSLGEVTSQTDPLGNKTTYTYDQLGDVASVTAPDGGVTAYTYDTNGDQLSATGPTGATVDATYDYLGRKVTSTQVERYPAAAAYTISYTYGTGGWLASQKTPDGVKTSYTYNAAGETASVTDGAGNTTSYSYNPAGQQTAVTYPDNTSQTTTYDEAGRPVAQADLNASGTVLRSDSAAYDANGNLLSSTGYRGNTATYTYNAANAPVSETQPVTATSGITTSFGYDAAGNRTLYVDGNGNSWWTTYNSWNLPQSQVEPPTSVYSSAADGTFTTAYDANGNPVTLTQPGGVTVTSTYNNMGQLTGQAGSGAGAPTATRSFGYNLAGEVTSAATSAAGSQPATSESFTYNDRGLVLSAAGAAGSSSFAYNGDGQPVSVTDAAGTTSYTYDSAGRLATLADPLTGTTASYSYNSMSQVSKISYGTGNDARTFGYNSLHQLTSDTLATSSGQSVASVAYGYDPNGNLTSKTTTGFAGSSSNTYTYDQANRLTSWDNGTATVNYAYDGAGNRTKAGSQTFTYDARDELTSNGTSSYAYTARGTLSSITGSSGTQSFTSDAYGQSVTQAGLSYGYDALARPVSVAGTVNGTVALSYAGPGNTLASDGTWSYTWGPGGTTLAGIGPAGGGTSAGVLAFTGAHTDVTGDFSPAGTTLAGSATYGPWGTVTASSGLAGGLGYQSGWSAPGSALVHMGARWYSPSAGQFTSRDSVSVNPVPASAAANPFAYVGDNPLTATDPTGHMLMMTGGGGYCSAACEASIRREDAALTRRAAPQPQHHSCGFLWLGCVTHDVVSGARHVGSAFTSGYHWAVHTYHHAVRDAGVVLNRTVRLADAGLNYLRGAFRVGIQLTGHLIRAARTRVADLARAGAHVIGHAWHATVSAGAAVVHTVTRYARHTYHHAVHLVKTVYHAAKRAATATVHFVKHHAAAIASVVVSVAVFAGCEAVLGGATAEVGGVGAIAGATECGALAGAAGNAVSYGITAAQTGKFSWSGLARATATGAVTGAVTGFAGGALAGGGSAAEGLLAGGAATSTVDAASTAAATGADATATAAASDSAASVGESSGNAAGAGSGGWLSRLLAPRATAHAMTEGTAPEAGGAATRVFWSGGDAAKSAATDFATANGGETIGMTAEGRALEAATQDMPWSKAQPLWDAASQRFASGASGDVHVFINVARANPESIWANTELPALVNNQNVPNVIFHLLG